MLDTYIHISKFTGKHLCQSVFFQSCGLQKKRLGTCVFCKFCKIFKNTFFYRIPPVTASVRAQMSMELGKSENITIIWSLSMGYRPVPLFKWMFGTSGKKARKTDITSFSVLINFAFYFYFSKHIFQKIAGIVEVENKYLQGKHLQVLNITYHI